VLTPAALAFGAVVGDDAVALSPISQPLLHATVAALVGAVLALGIYGISFLLQRRMMTEVQAMVPKT
jgi:hypothetical protein